MKPKTSAASKSPRKKSKPNTASASDPVLYSGIEADLPEYQRILANAEEIAKIGSWKWDLRSQKVTWSDEMFRLFGMEREGFDGDVNRVIAERIHPDDVAAVMEANHRVLEEADPVPLSYRILLPDGTERTVWAQGRLVGDEAGQPQALTGFVQDITDRVQAERKILQLKRLYATLSQVNQMIVRVKERDELFRTICDVAIQFGEFTFAWVGLFDEESGEVQPLASCPPDQFQLTSFNILMEEHKHSLIAESIRTSNVKTGEYPLADAATSSPDGHILSLPDHSTAIIPFRLRGRPVGILALLSREPGVFKDEDEIRLLDEMGLDISFALDNMENEKERQQAEKEIWSLAKFPGENPNPVLRIANNGVLLYANESSQPLIELWKGEVGARLPDEICEIISEVEQSGTPREVELHCDDRIFNVAFIPITNTGYVNGYGRDVTESRRAEARAAYQSYLLENVHDAVLATDSQFRITSWNHAAEELYGYTEKEALGKKVQEVIRSSFDEEQRSAAVRALNEKGAYRTEVLQSHRDGQQFWVEGNTLALKELNGQIKGYISINRDITERKRAETQVQSRSRQLTALLEASQSLIESLDLAEVLQKIADQSAYVLETEATAIYLVEDGLLYLGASTPALPSDFPETMRRSALADHPHIASAVTTLQSVTITDTHSARLTEAEQSISTVLGLRTVVYLPLIDRKDVIGILILGTIGKTREFTRDELDLARALSNQAVLAITNAKLYKNLALYVAQLEREIAERRQVEEAILRNQHVLRLFVEHSPASIAMFDRHMQYIIASRRYRIDYRLGEQNLTGRSHYDVFPEIPDRWKQIHQRCLQGAIEKADEDPFPREDGSLDWVRWEIRPWYEETDKIGGIILFSEVITERKQVQDELRTLNQELEERVQVRTLELSHANRAKDEFLANMSHELRTPLNTVLGLSETLLEQRRGPLNEKQVRSLELISSSGQHLLNVINDILEVSKIEAGKLELHPTSVHVKELCESSLNFVKEMALRKQILLEFHARETMASFRADPQRVKQILINLLTNAVKFTPERGRVSLQVSTNREENQILFSITDTGIGIAGDDLRKLFTPFVQLDSSLARQFSGTGLGLALVQKLTELHGGSVHVESEINKGSCFTIVLPLDDGLPEPIPVESTSAPVNTRADSIKASEAVQKQPGVILLAEDNRTNSEMMSEYLEAQGYRVIKARDGEEVLEKALETPPDLIVMDIQMPKLDGLEATRQLRADPRFISTPIIALTALAMPSDKERCFEAGVNEYLSKPVSLRKLLQVIERLTG